MNGNDRQGLIVQARDRRLLQELDTMRIIDRELAKLVAGFGSTTRANTRLLALTKAGLLQRTFVGTIAGGRKAIYALSSQGAGLVSAKHPAFSIRSRLSISGNLKLEHQWQIASIYAAVKFQPIPVSEAKFLAWKCIDEPLLKNSRIIPDGYFEIEQRPKIHAMFLEVDMGTELQKVWQAKTQNYLQLAVSGRFEQIFARPQFRVLVVATSEKRLNAIQSTVLKSTDKIFRFSTFDFINREGFWSPIWYRPKGDERQSLL
jgi:hypothetical protein